MLAAEGLHFDSVYRKNKNEFIDEIQRSGRERSVVETIEKQDIKSCQYMQELSLYQSQ